MGTAQTPAAKFGAKLLHYLVPLGTILFFAAFIFWPSSSLDLITPSARVTDFESYLQEMKAPTRLQILLDKERLVLVTTGDTKHRSFNDLPSGPPQYVFSTEGKLLDWTTDCLKGKGWFAGKSILLVKSVSIEEARTWLAEQKSVQPSSN